MDHALSELSTMTCQSWVTLRGMGHSFIELEKVVIHVITEVICVLLKTFFLVKYLLIHECVPTSISLPNIYILHDYGTISKLGN